MSTFTSSTKMSFAKRGKRQRGRTTETRIDFAYFVLTIIGLTILSYQSEDFHSNYGTKPSLFLGTQPVSAATAAALSINAPRTGRPTKVTMTAGSSRTLIELTNQENEGMGEFKFELSFLDEDDEHGLLVLRRANVDAVHSSETSSLTEGGQAVLKRAVEALKNPVVLLVLAGNIASMSGILPPGVAGFLPALGIFLRNKIKLTAPVLGKLGSLKFGKALVCKLKVKFGNLISNLYKNRSKYSLLSDCLWYIDADGKKSSKEANKKNKNTSDHRASTASTYRVVA